MYRVNLTKDQASRVGGSNSIEDTFSVLLEAAGTDTILRYLTTPAPRPPLRIAILGEIAQPVVDIPTELRRIELGIDGNAAFALLGDDIQSGESEFVTIVSNDVGGEISAAKLALRKLRDRLNAPEYPYFFGTSHPYGNG